MLAVVASMLPAHQGQDIDKCPFLQAGYTHRDLRWPNISCTEEHRYFLLDLELCAKPGKAPSNIATWPNDILQGNGAYTEASDILVLGHMLSTLNIDISPEGRKFLQQMWPCVPDEAVPTAEDLLHDPWISCTGDSCRTAGAHPNTLSPTV